MYTDTRPNDRTFETSFFVRDQPSQIDNHEPSKIVTPNHQVNKNERKRGFMIQDYDH